MFQKLGLILQYKNIFHMEISQQQYEAALNRIEELLPLVSDDTPPENPNVVELIKVSEIVREYELKHYPIGESEQ